MVDGAARNSWLGELVRAIDEAQRLAWHLGVVDSTHPQALELYVRLECVRAEVEAMHDRTRPDAMRLPPFDTPTPVSLA